MPIYKSRSQTAKSRMLFSKFLLCILTLDEVIVWHGVGIVLNTITGSIFSRFRWFQLSLSLSLSLFIRVCFSSVHLLTAAFTFKSAKLFYQTIFHFIIIAKEKALNSGFFRKYHVNFISSSVATPLAKFRRHHNFVNLYESVPLIFNSFRRSWEHMSEWRKIYLMNFGNL